LLRGAHHRICGRRCLRPHAPCGRGRPALAVAPSPPGADELFWEQRELPPLSLAPEPGAAPAAGALAGLAAGGEEPLTRLSLAAGEAPRASPPAAGATAGAPLALGEAAGLAGAALANRPTGGGDGDSGGRGGCCGDGGGGGGGSALAGDSAAPAGPGPAAAERLVVFAANAGGSRMYAASPADGRVYVLRGLITTRLAAAGVAAFLQRILS
jgi:hypothetical protein